MYTTVLVSDSDRGTLSRLLNKVGTVLTPSSEEECLGMLRSGADIAVVVQREDGGGGRQAEGASGERPKAATALC